MSHGLLEYAVKSKRINAATDERDIKSPQVVLEIDLFELAGDTGSGQRGRNNVRGLRVNFDAAFLKESGSLIQRHSILDRNSLGRKSAERFERVVVSVVIFELLKMLGQIHLGKNRRKTVCHVDVVRLRVNRGQPQPRRFQCNVAPRYVPLKNKQADSHDPYGCEQQHRNQNRRVSESGVVSSRADASAPNERYEGARKQLELPKESAVAGSKRVSKKIEHVVESSSVVR